MAHSEFKQDQNVGASLLHVPTQYCVADGDAPVVAHWDMLRTAMRSLCALLNSVNGGSFFIGVSMDGEIEGIISDHLPTDKLAEDAQLLFSHSCLMKPKVARDAYLLKFPVIRIGQEMDSFVGRSPQDCSARSSSTPNPSRAYLMKVEVHRPAPELQFYDGVAYRWEKDTHDPATMIISQLPDCSNSVVTFENLLTAYSWGIENSEAAEQKESEELARRLQKLDLVIQTINGQIIHFVQRDAKRRFPPDSDPLRTEYATSSDNTSEVVPPDDIPAVAADAASLGKEDADVAPPKGSAVSSGRTSGKNSVKDPDTGSAGKGSLKDGRNTGKSSAKTSGRSSVKDPDTGSAGRGSLKEDARGSAKVSVKDPDTGLSARGSLKDPDTGLSARGSLKDPDTGSAGKGSVKDPDKGSAAARGSLKDPDTGSSGKGSAKEDARGSRRSSLNESDGAPDRKKSTPDSKTGPRKSVPRT